MLTAVETFKENSMDIVYVGAILALWLLTLGVVVACDKLGARK